MISDLRMNPYQYLVLARYNYEAGETEWGHKYLLEGLATIANRFD